MLSGGVAIEYLLSGDGHTLTAYKGAGREAQDQVFVVEVTNPDGSSTPGYRFTLHGALDHAADNANLALAFGFEAKETETADGDSVSGNFTITVVDDVPVATSQTEVSLAEGGVAVGYVGGSYTDGTVNLLANDTKGAYGARIHQVKYIDGSGTEQTVVIAADQTSTGELDTQYGKLTVHADGTWSYTSDAAIAHANGEAVSDPFSYTLKDGDGDVSD